MTTDSKAGQDGHERAGEHDSRRTQDVSVCARGDELIYRSGVECQLLVGAGLPCVDRQKLFR